MRQRQTDLKADVKDPPVCYYVRATTSQYAAVSALKMVIRNVEMMRESYDQRRRFLLNAFREMGIDCFEPLGAFYTFPNISRFGMTSEEFATKLLMEEKVAVVPGTALVPVEKALYVFPMRTP